MREPTARSNKNHAPPDQVTLVYRKVGKTHVFTAQELSGFHIGSGTLDYAFKMAVAALGEHVTMAYDCKAEYQAEASLGDFKARLKSNDLSGPIVMARRMELQAAA